MRSLRLAVLVLFAALPAAAAWTAGAVDFDQGFLADETLKEAGVEGEIRALTATTSLASSEFTLREASMRRDLLLLAASGSSASPEITLETLTASSQKKLDAIFAASPAGPIPSGDSKGKVVFFGKSILGKIAAFKMGLLWQGKIFSIEDGQPILVNKILGFHGLKAKIYKGKGWLDGKESIILDYKETTVLAHFFIDEIRLVAPDLYLGRFYKRTPFGKLFLGNFVLSFASASQPAS